MRKGMERKRARKPPMAQTVFTPAPVPETLPEYELYEALRREVPVIDAAIRKITRLAGGFSLRGESERATELLERFAASARVNGMEASLGLFCDQMLDSLLTYGNACAELICDGRGNPAGLRTVHPKALRVRQDSGGELVFETMDARGAYRAVANPERVLFAALDPPAGSVRGVSILRGLSGISEILLTVYRCIGANYERAGNIRYAVTYHPDERDAGFAREHTEEIARAWAEGTAAERCGEARDFVTCGDVDIKVIGAENRLMDTNVPVRQLLEQIVSKLSIPPFLLGLSWSTTERMSAQQADILTSELEAFRRALTPVLLKIARAVLRASGIYEEPSVEWQHINLQDERELAEARLKNAQARQIELLCAQMKGEDLCTIPSD